MLVTVFSIVLALVSTSFGSAVQSDRLTLKSRLGDHSWNIGHSSLVAIGADSTCTAIFSCADCNTAQICRPTSGGSLVPVTQIACPADRPFCDFSTGSCTTVPDDSCGQTDDFICLQAEGHFPDANCSQYHVCDNYTPHKFECKIAGHNYNADRAQCESSNQCATFNCDGSGKKVASNIYPSYYAYCETGNPLKPGVIDRCEGINQLNATSQLCEPICSEEGVIQDVEDCTKYYKCSYLWINDTTKFMTRERLNCPEETGFDPSNFICVSLSEIPDCRAPTVPPPTTTTTTTPSPQTSTSTSSPQPTTTPTTTPSPQTSTSTSTPQPTTYTTPNTTPTPTTTPAHF